MNCTNGACTGEYRDRLIVQAFRHNGGVAVIDHIPAEVCWLCGDTLLKPETVQRIEELMEGAAPPAATAPLYDYASTEP